MSQHLVFKNAAEYTYKLLRNNLDNGSTLGMVIPHVFSVFKDINKDTYWDYVKALLEFKPKDGKVPSNRDQLWKDDINPKTIPVCSPFIWNVIPELDCKDIVQVSKFVEDSPVDFHRPAIAAFSSLWQINKWKVNLDTFKKVYSSDTASDLIKWSTFNTDLLDDKAFFFALEYCYDAYIKDDSKRESANKNKQKKEQLPTLAPYPCLATLLSKTSITKWPDKFKKELNNPIKNTDRYKYTFNTALSALKLRAKNDDFILQEQAELKRILKIFHDQAGSTNGLWSALADNVCISKMLVDFFKKQNPIDNNIALELIRSKLLGIQIMDNLDMPTIKTFSKTHPGLLIQEYMTNDQVMLSFRIHIKNAKDEYDSNIELEFEHQDNVNKIVSFWKNAKHELLKPYLYMDMYAIKDLLLDRDKKKMEQVLGFEFNKLEKRLQEEYKISPALADLMSGSPYTRLSNIQNHLNTTTDVALSLPELDI